MSVPNDFKIVPPINNSSTLIDEKDKKEKAYNSKSKKKYEAEMANAHLDNFKQDIALRKEYAEKLFSMLSWYLICTGILIFLTSAKGSGFEMSDNVSLMLLGTTTFNMVGLFIVVANYLFPNKTSK